MNKAIITGVRQAAVVEAPNLQPKGDWVVVKVYAAPMCTEYKLFVSGQKAEFLGHEAAGEVMAVAQPGRVQVGDRVVVQPLHGCGVCRLCASGDYIHCQSAPSFASLFGSNEGSATYAQYLLKPSWLLSPIPDGVPYDLAGLACCGLGPTFSACERMNVNAFDAVLITGLGAVGLGGVVNAKYRGARVIGVESVPYRADYARRLGADEIVDPTAPDALDQIMALTEGRGVDAAMDCSGVVAAQRLCVDAVRRRGQMAFIGECRDALPLVGSDDMLRKGIALHGIWHYNLALFPKVMQVIQRSPVVKDLISHTFPMSQVQRALEVSATHECGKIVLHPWE
jgi:threonine dehydrogenase-like Zn-dependent dehydrogenase